MAADADGDADAARGGGSALPRQSCWRYMDALYFCYCKSRDDLPRRDEDDEDWDGFDFSRGAVDLLRMGLWLGR